MKKMKYILSGLLALTIMSCSKESPIGETPLPGSKGKLVVSIPGTKAKSGTKAPSDPFGKGEQNASEILVENIYVYLFNKSTGTLQYYSDAEFYNGDIAQFPLFTSTGGYQGGTVASGDEVTAIFVANYRIPVANFTVGATTPAQFRDMQLPEVTSDLASPFVMYGEGQTDITIQPQGSATLSQAAMVRLAARIDITNELSSRVVINSAQVFSGTTSSALSPLGTPVTTYKDFSEITNTGYNTVTGIKGDEAGKDNMWSHLYAYANDNISTPTKVVIKYTIQGIAKTADIDFIDANTDEVIAIDRNNRYEIKVTQSIMDTPEFGLSVTGWDDSGMSNGSSITDPALLNVLRPKLSDGEEYTPNANGATLKISGLGATVVFDYTSASAVTLEPDLSASAWASFAHTDASTTYSVYSAQGGYKGSVTVNMVNNKEAERSTTFSIKSGNHIKTYTITQANDATAIPTVQTNSNSFIVAPGGAAIVFEANRANADGITRISAGDHIGAVLVWTDNKNGLAPNGAVSEIRTYRQDVQTLISVTPGSEIGNAVIAAYNYTSKRIVWSWHIWVTDYNPETKNDSYTTATATTSSTATAVYGTSVIMDRDLGALSNIPGDVKTHGLFYQWGRKDPFISKRSWINNSIEPPIYDAQGRAFHVPRIFSHATPNGGNPNNLEYAISNPAYFICSAIATNINFDWYTSVESRTSQNDELWGFKGDARTDPKGIYDPCPAGWRVPRNGTFQGLQNTTDDAWRLPWSPSKFGRFGTRAATIPTDLVVGPTDSYIPVGSPGTSVTLGYFPAPGYRHYTNGNLTNVGTYSHSWASGVSAQNGIFQYFAWHTVSPTSTCRGYGLQVRCVKDN